MEDQFLNDPGAFERLIVAMEDQGVFDMVVPPWQFRVMQEVLMDEPIMQFFAYEHLRPDLQEVSKPFSDLAARIVTVLPSNPERTVALRKLLESKDAAVRAKLYV